MLYNLTITRMIKKTFLALTTILFFFSTSLVAQEYNEEKTLAQLEKYLDNPKLYHEKITSLMNQIKEAQAKNQKTIKEYESLIAQKDSTILAYKNRGNRTSTNLASSAKPTTPAPTSSPAKATANTSSPFKVQIAALQKDDIKKYLNTPKYLSFTNLGDRNVFEVAGFTNETEAYEFSQYLRRTGISGAFVSKYDNGTRVEDYDYLKANNISGMSSPFSKSSSHKMSLDYPTSIPLGYQEIMSGKADLTSQSAASTPPASIPSTPKSTTIKSPKTTSTPPAPASGTSKSQIDETFNKIFGR